MFQSAANLAFSAGKHREIERMIGFALSGNPPYPINEELKILLQRIGTVEEVEIENTLKSVNSISEQIKKLPTHLRKEVADFVEFLIMKHLGMNC